MKLYHNTKSEQANGTKIIRFMKMMVQTVNDLFKPEEVEVTFQNDGKGEKYTYIKIEHKQVA